MRIAERSTISYDFHAPSSISSGSEVPLCMCHEAQVCLRSWKRKSSIPARCLAVSQAVELRQCEWVVYAKRPFAGPEAVLAYLSRYTHRVAISNSRLVAADDRGVTFRWKDYREHGRTRYKMMTLGTQEFMRRFLLHVLPSGLSAHASICVHGQASSNR